MRKRLDLERPVPRDVIEECIEIALQAPSGSNRQAWQWIPVDDPDTKAGIAELYRAVFDSYQPRSSGYVEGDTRAERRDAVTASSVHLRDHLHEVPVLLVSTRRAASRRCLRARIPASGVRWCRPSGASCWRPERGGMGSVWTTMTCRKEEEMAELLGVRHDEYTQIGLFPVAYTIGTDFKPAPRLDPASVIRWNRW